MYVVSDSISQAFDIVSSVTKYADELTVYLKNTRRVYLPKTVAEMLIDWKKDQDLAKEELGDEYHDYQLVLAGPFGTPMESSRISVLLNQLIKEHDLPKVVFHSLRHSSITYKRNARSFRK